MNRARVIASDPPGGLGEGQPHEVGAEQGSVGGLEWVKVDRYAASVIGGPLAVNDPGYRTGPIDPAVGAREPEGEADRLPNPNGRRRAYQQSVNR